STTIEEKNAGGEQQEAETVSSKVVSRIKEFEDRQQQQSIFRKKHVHFRMRQQQQQQPQLARSRSTSHIITETIQEEESEQNYYDDVASNMTTTRSVDDVTMTTGVDDRPFEHFGKYCCRFCNHTHTR